MDLFYGKWKVQLDQTSGVEEYGKLFGWDDEKRKMFASLEYTLLIEAQGERTRCFLDYNLFNATLDFKLGEEFDYTSPDGNKAMLTVVEQDGKLIESYRRPDGVTWKTTRSIDGNTMTAKTTYGENSECVQLLVRV